HLDYPYTLVFTLRLRLYFLSSLRDHPAPHSFPTRRSSDLTLPALRRLLEHTCVHVHVFLFPRGAGPGVRDVHPHPLRSLPDVARSEEHTSELQSLAYLVCRLLLEKKKNKAHDRVADALPAR